MEQHLSPERLKKLLEAEDLSQVETEQLIHFFQQDSRLQDKLPNGLFAVDPRNHDRVLFNPARAHRPHDVSPASDPAGEQRVDCPICAGDTTGVVDFSPLSEGFTFINKNMFPMMYPFIDEPARGLHFLQWTSNFHRRDWHNLDTADCQVVLQRLAELERKWVEDGTALAPEARAAPYVSIIKNAGGGVGASLQHGHQQIAVGNVMPRRIQDHLAFREHHRRVFSRWMLDRLNPALIVEDLGPAVLLVPHFMKRPYDMLLLVRATEKAHLFDLDDDELEAVARGWHRATALINRLMPRLGQPPAYNVLVHNGPGAGLYFEFKPHTQVTGGFERIGLHVCQGSPEQAAADLRAELEGL
jgi:galactose-1-phosphate uridylyltransferase